MVSSSPAEAQRPFVGQRGETGKMRQATLVALYGHKPDALTDVLLSCQRTLSSELSGAFQPYDLPRVHATIVGLERSLGTDLENLNFSRFRSCRRTMDIRGFASALVSSRSVLFQIQIGGFQNRGYPFVSRGENPYARSFSIQGDKAVIVGWPVRRTPWAKLPDNPTDLLQESRLYPTSLDDVRRSAQAFGILHSYHRGFTDLDNDFYLRVGVFRRTVDQSTAEKLSARLREQLSAASPAILEITTSHLHVVSYEEDTLPVETSRAIRLDALPDSSELVSRLYC